MYAKLNKGWAAPQLSTGSRRFRCWCKLRASRSHHRPLLSGQYTFWDKRFSSSLTASCGNNKGWALDTYTPSICHYTE